jgi:hypothetical protein
MFTRRQPIAEHTRRLYQDRDALVRKINRYQTDLANVRRLLQLGALSITVGLSVLWLGFADVTIDSTAFEVCGALLMSVGIPLLLLAIKVKIRYTVRLASLKRSLDDLDDLLTHQKVFPETFRETLGLPYHTYYEDFVKERQAVERRVHKMIPLQTFLRVYQMPTCMILAGLSLIVPALLQGPGYDPIIVGGLGILLGIFWGLLNRRKHKTLT